MSIQNKGSQNGFSWFYGVVENRKDPLKLGRCQVRCLGYHTENKNDIPTNDLPWAHPILPLTGYGNEQVKLVEGMWVLGFFQDGSNAQFPIIAGILPGIPEQKADGKFGFNDPREIDGTLSESPKTVKSRTYNDDGIGGVELIENDPQTFPQKLKESDLSRLIRNEKINETIIQDKKVNQHKNIKIAAYNSTNQTYDEPEIPYNATYPYNNVMESESGHIMEIDDTPGSERMHVFHRSGSCIEIYPDGTKVMKIVGDDYEIVLKDKNVYVSGSCNITVQNNCNMLVEGNLTAEVDGNSKIHNKGTLDVLSEKDITIESNQNVIIKGERIDLNP